jgi:hypothetical protein
MVLGALQKGLLGERATISSGTFSSRGSSSRAMPLPHVYGASSTAPGAASTVRSNAPYQLPRATILMAPLSPLPALCLPSPPPPAFRQRKEEILCQGSAGGGNVHPSISQGSLKERVQGEAGRTGRRRPPVRGGGAACAVVPRHSDALPRPPLRRALDAAGCTTQASAASAQSPGGCGERYTGSVRAALGWEAVSAAQRFSHCPI